MSSCTWKVGSFPQERSNFGTMSRLHISGRLQVVSWMLGWHLSLTSRQRLPFDKGEHISLAENCSGEYWQVSLCQSTVSTQTHLPLGHTQYYSLLFFVCACTKDSLTVFCVLGCGKPVGTTGSLKRHLPTFFLLPPIYQWSLEYRTFLHWPNWIFLKILL